MKSVLGGRPAFARRRPCGPIALIVLCIFGLAWAASVAVAARPSATGPAVWVIEAEGESTWIMGTLHQLPRRKGGSPQRALHFLPWWKGAVRVAMSRSDIYVQEVVEGNAAAARAIERESSADDTERLRSYLDEQRYAQVARALDSIGVTSTLLERAEPLAILLVVAFASEPVRDASLMGVESWLERRAIAERKQRLGLETAEDRITAVVSVLDRVEVQRQAELVVELAELLSGDDRLGDGFDALYHAWEAGDMDALEAALIEYAELSPELHEAFLVARNRLWIGRIEDLIGNRRNELVAVGIAHLAGPANLIDMLRERGHVVRRVQ